MIDDYPVRWTAPEVQETLRLLQTTIYKQGDIERIVVDAGLSPAEIEWHPRPALTWRSVFDRAAGNRAVDALLDEVIKMQPALEVRLSELRASDGQVITDELPPSDPARLDFDSPAWKNFSPDGQAEAIIVAGQPTFLDVSFLAVGVDRARSVCRILGRFPEEVSGTGFRIGEQLLLTNHHVLFDHQRGDRKVISAEAWFNYESDERGKPRKIVQIECDPDSVVGEKADDWAVIRAVEPIPDDFPPLPLVGSQAPKEDDRVYIIQHPNGLPKKVAFQHNLVRAVTPETIQYWTDTDLGSSGSPVFDETWQVVGLTILPCRRHTVTGSTSATKAGASAASWSACSSAASTQGEQ